MKLCEKQNLLNNIENQFCYDRISYSQLLNT